MLDLTVSFGHNLQFKLQQYADMPDRELFYYLLHADEFPALMPHALGRVRQTLAEAQNLSASGPLPDYLELFDYTPDAFGQRMQVLHQQGLTATDLPEQPFDNPQCAHLLKQYAPQALLDGCWLQNISTTANNHTEVASRLFQVYARRIGDGDTTAHYGNLYRGLLHSARIYLPEVSSSLFGKREDIHDSAFTIPVFQLALSLFPRVCLPELIGFTLGHFFNPPDPLLAALHGQLQQAGLDTRYYQQGIRSEVPSGDAQGICEAVVLYLADCEDEGMRQQHWRRIWTGLLAHQFLNCRWQAGLQEWLSEPRTLTAHQKMLALMAAKVPHARNMHRNRKVGGQLINDWFAQEPFDAEGFLQALAASPYVNRKEPGKSMLLTRSVTFGGPMFRIFTDAEQAVMAGWVASLANRDGQEDASTPAPLALPRPAARPAPASLDEAADLAKYAKCNKRELYYHFVNADLYPDVLPTARKVAGQFFQQAKKEMGKRGLDAQLRPFPYSHAAFEQRIRDIYTSELDAYEAFVPPSTVPREIMVWFTWQYAPFPMVDGSWVQHIARAGMSHTEISARLFRIYSDEVGNANTRLNHPNVYRQMLEGEGIRMPPTDSLDFALQPAIKDFAFDLPLLTLSVSLSPRDFLPEIIGVNLAIELSGLGKGYMQIIDELKFWKIDPYFFTLHLTIDNIASGHTAVAMETVHLYLDQILATQGQQAMQREWERIWVGYLAFRQNMTRFDATLERQASLRFLVPLIRLHLMRGKKKKQPPVDKAA